MKKNANSQEYPQMRCKRSGSLTGPGGTRPSILYESHLTIKVVLIMRKLAVLPLLCALLQGPVLARHDSQACGTHAQRTREELFLHRRWVARNLRFSQTLSSTTSQVASSQSQDIGQIALIDDNNGVIGRRNPFDLNRKTLTFLPVNRAASAYTFQVTGASYDEAAPASGTRVILKDDDSKPFSLPFPFPFYGQKYQQLFINSDGNVSFTIGDSSTSDRSLGQLTAGPPRIAPLYTDLDPSAASSAQQGVIVTAESTRMVVSWVQVPVYADSSNGRPQSFQLRLYPDGRIEMAWSDTAVSAAVVGISPGRLQGTSSVLSFSTGSASEFSGAIAESFSGLDRVDIVTTAQKFYQSHEDAYDYLVIFNAEGISAGSGVVAYEVTARNSRTGYGDDLVDIGQEFGSPRRLQAVLNMGPLSQYPLDPNGIVSARFSVGDTPLTVLGHEAGHLFLAFASVADPGNASAKPMLGRALAHWSFLFNSEASLLEGNRIQDNGPDASPRFTTIGTVQGYSALDQYLMGFRAPEEVPPTFLVANSPEISSGDRGPKTGVVFNGQRRDVTVDQLIDSTGRRTPDSTVAQRRFRFAFLLIVPPGSTPSAEQIAQVETYRSGFETFYQSATASRASADATLKRALHLSVFPAAGVLAGSAGTASISLDTPSPTPLTVLLHTNSGAVTAPSSVTIPAGAERVVFALSGVRPGIDTLTVEPADFTYETGVANIQVLSSAAALKLELVSGDKQPAVAGQALSQPVVFRITDVNQLPYPNVRVTSHVTGGGSADVSAKSDENGLVRFTWTPGPGPVNQLTLAIANGPQSTAVALGRPAFAAAAVVNAASFVSGISPGGIATLFGTNLLDASVLINGVPTTVFFANNQQVNFLVPDTLSEGSAQVSVNTSIGSSDLINVAVTSISPGLFAAVNRSAYIEIYATGLGPLDGKSTITRPQVSIGSSQAEVLYSGLAPGFKGLYQINAGIPAGTPPDAPVLIELAGKKSNTVPLQFP